MEQMGFLIAESGSTKTDWCFYSKSTGAQAFTTSGMNPYLQSASDMQKLLQEQCAAFPRADVDAVYFYGAGAGSIDQQQKVKTVLTQIFDSAYIEVNGDMMAACRALCGNSSGFVAILGTGSNSCFYEYGKISVRHASLGYLLADEGSGNHLGKKILREIGYHRVSPELQESFQQMFPGDFGRILRKLYQEPFPNRYLATFVQFLKIHRTHPQIAALIRSAFDEFFELQLLRFPAIHDFPVHFSGSVAFEFQEILGELCSFHKIQLGNVLKSPVEHLLAYHLTHRRTPNSIVPEE